MKTVTFHNSTALDPKAFRLMGISVKEEDSIGLFGTGLKYAIATILRLGDSIEIESNGETFKFGKTKTDFRGEELDVVTCNGEELAFTTSLGKLWEPWMAYRELFSNALDEGGGATDGEIDAITKIRVSGSVIPAVHAEKDKYFLFGNSDYETENLAVYFRFTDYSFYN